MTKPTILITGSTGKTGFFAAKTLLEKGYPVKAMTRRNSDTTKELEALGAEIVIANLLDLASLEKSMQGVERAYLIYPPEDGLLEATANFIVAAQAAGVKAIVNMSQLPARKYHTSALTRQHWLAEQMLNNTNMLVTHVLPSFFSEMLYLMNGASILQEGKMYLQHGEAYHAPITGEDIMKTFDIRPSEQIGILKKEIKNAILDGAIENNYDAAFKFLIERAKKLGLRPVQKK